MFDVILDENQLEDACEHLAEFLDAYWKATHPVPVPPSPKLSSSSHHPQGLSSSSSSHASKQTGESPIHRHNTAPVQHSSPMSDSLDRQHHRSVRDVVDSAHNSPDHRYSLHGGGNHGDSMAPERSRIGMHQAGISGPSRPDVHPEYMDRDYYPPQHRRGHPHHPEGVDNRRGWGDHEMDYMSNYPAAPSSSGPSERSLHYEQQQQREYRESVHARDYGPRGLSSSGGDPRSTSSSQRPPDHYGDHHHHHHHHRGNGGRGEEPPGGGDNNQQHHYDYTAHEKQLQQHKSGRKHPASISSSPRTMPYDPHDPYGRDYDRLHQTGSSQDFRGSVGMRLSSSNQERLHEEGYHDNHRGRHTAGGVYYRDYEGHDRGVAGDYDVDYRGGGGGRELPPHPAQASTSRGGTRRNHSSHSANLQQGELASSSGTAGGSLHSSAPRGQPHPAHSSSPTRNQKSRPPLKQASIDI